MKKATLLLLFATSFYFSGIAQLNMNLLSQVEYPQDLNDVWGWADPETGIEYAIVGLRNGTSIVSLEDPENAVEVAYVPGPSSTWRDMKTWGNFAYVTNETSNGLLVIDMTSIDDNGNVDFFEWTPTLPGLGTLNTCHNLYIDEFGYCYLVGCDINNGGAVILNVDVNSPIGEPEYVAAGPSIYSHDAFVKSNIFYASEIYAGTMTIYDVSDKQNIQELGRQSTPLNFTHNIWTTDDETVAFTTDERADAPVAAYDITDFDDIQELDRYNPIGSLGTGVIPHNVHVWDEYLLISYYTDGGRVVDASRPENLIEVGNYDSWLGNDGGFSGAWGLYPFLPSQTVLVTDINNGLYVLEPNFVRACWLEGIVTDESNGNAIPGATVEIDSEQPNFTSTNATGDFETGQAIPGSFEVTFKKPGYNDEVVTVDLDNGVLTFIEVEMTPFSVYEISGEAIEAAGGAKVANAFVQLIGEDLSYDIQADANGDFSLTGVVEGEYDIVGAQWGYLHTLLEDVVIDGNTAITVEFEKGYQDDFFADLGWTTDFAGASSGYWERAEPTGTFANGQLYNPEVDANNDLGNQCYMTGNGGGGGGTDDVDDGTVFLFSPIMDLSDYIDPVMSYSYWFNNAVGPGNVQPNDTLKVVISNGITEVVIENHTFPFPQWVNSGEIQLGTLIELTDQMQVIVSVSDDPAFGGNIAEGAFDAFLVEEQGIVNNLNQIDANISFEVFPNPFNSQTLVAFELNNDNVNAELSIYNATGQLIERRKLDATNGKVFVGDQLNSGLYLINLEVDGQIVKSSRIVKTQ